MKLWAVLKDSFREAVDFKTLYVMVFMSLLTVFLCLTFSFRAAPAKDAFENVVLTIPPGKNMALAMRGVEGGLAVIYLVDDFKEADEDAKPWLGRYSFTLSAIDQIPKAFRMVNAVRKMNPSMAQLDQEDMSRFPIKLMEAEKEVQSADMEEFVRTQIAAVSRFKVEHVKIVSQKDNEVKFEVTVQGTPDAFPTWPHRINLLFGAYKTDAMLQLGPTMFIVENYLVSYGGAAVALLISTIITAFFIPNMLRKGNIDLLISKPISRPTLLVYKYLGGLTFMFLNTLVVVGGMWLALGVRTGIWAPAFLVMIPVLTFEFAIYYAVSTLMAVLTRSPIVAILATCLFWAVLFGEGFFYRFATATKDMKPRPMSDSVYVAEDVLHFVLPRVTDLDMLATYVLSKNLLAPGDADRRSTETAYGKVKWGESISVSVGFIAVLLGLGCWRFSTRDY